MEGTTEFEGGFKPAGTDDVKGERMFANTTYQHLRQSTKGLTTGTYTKEACAEPYTHICFRCQ